LNSFISICKLVHSEDLAMEETAMLLQSGGAELRLILQTFFVQHSFMFRFM
jgi:hypothetical protein